jgi:hypothetical protein
VRICNGKKIIIKPVTVINKCLFYSSQNYGSRGQQSKPSAGRRRFAAKLCAFAKQFK